MPKYVVYYSAGASTTVEVDVEESEVPDDLDILDVVYEKAEAAFSPPRLCHHCSGKMDLSDWDLDDSEPELV